MSAGRPVAEPGGALVSRRLVVAALRAATPRALAVVARRLGDFDDAEDAVQEALVQAAQQWTRDGIPENPTGWLVTVAWRRAIDAVRADASRRERERRALLLEPPATDAVASDDTLALFFLCCHPALSRPAQIALTLRAVGGLTTHEIARGLVLSESTVAQRISRAKATLRRAGARFAPAAADDLATRVGVVLDVLGVIHTESHSATAGDEITRPALAAEALRLSRALLVQTDASAPWRGEVMGATALMLLTDARAPARVDARGELVALADQDRTLWRADLIAEGDALLTAALSQHPLGRYQLRAAIAAVHDTAPTSADTDWHQLLGLYDLLRVVDPGPIVELGRLIPYARVHGADVALLELDRMPSSAPAGRVAAVRAHLVALGGGDASPEYGRAAEHAGTGAERRWFARMALGGAAEGR